ncbi:MAG: SGNH/GDSL hydrolase family protein [Aromatoleum sp.]|nr:SGNH/GDSL hydrolase family protein [Aromatoleum sp.]
MRRLTIFAKGNLDVRDTLHSLRVGGKLQWNGINEIVRERFPSTLVRVRHETWTRSDALLESGGSVPADLAERAPPALASSAHPAPTQFSIALFETDADAIVLSVQPDVATTLARHRRHGYLFHPGDWQSWSDSHRRWLRDEFAAEGLVDAGTSMHNFERIVARIRQRSAAPILVYNLSSVVPGDTVHCHAGLGETLSTRIRRFNLGIAELSQRTGISVIDVDAVVARAGAAGSKTDVFHLNAEGCRLVAEETVRVLEDLGCFAAEERNRCE